MKKTYTSSALTIFSVSGLIASMGVAAAAVSLGDKLGTTEEEVRSALTNQGYAVEEIETEDGKLEAFVEAGLECMWEDNQKMDDKDVFVAALTAKGFDGAALLERTQDPAIKKKLIDNTEMAVSRGVFGIPTFFVGDEMFFGKERLAQIEEEVQRAG